MGWIEIIERISGNRQKMCNGYRRVLVIFLYIGFNGIIYWIIFNCYYYVIQFFVEIGSIKYLGVCWFNLGVCWFSIKKILFGYWS